MQQTFVIGECRILLQQPQSAAPQTVVYLHADPAQAHALCRRLGELPTDCPFALVSVDGVDWNRDLSPWPAPKAFKGGTDFGGGANAYLKTLTQEILPAAEQALPAAPARRILAGYSMAGLFALYATYQTDKFARAACMSGSLWYDGFLDFMKTRQPPRWPEFVYLSLGNKEKQTKNSRLAAVEERTREAASLLCAAGVRVLYREQEGGHFANVPERLAEGVHAALYAADSGLAQTPMNSSAPFGALIP